MIKHWIRAPLVGVAVIMIGTLGYAYLEGVSLFDALYMTVITVTTIGYAEQFPLSPLSKLFTIALGLGGIGIIFWGASDFAQRVFDGKIGLALGMRRRSRMLNALSNHFIVCGYGRMGRWVVETFQSNRNPLIVIDHDPNRATDAEQDKVKYLIGDASDPEILKAAGIARARALVCCLPDDANNVYTVLLARQKNPKLRIISRAIHEDAIDRLCLAGADQVINPYKIGGHRLAYSAMKPALIDFLDTTMQRMGEDLIIEEILLESESELVGQSLSQSQIRSKLDVVVVGLKRGEAAFFNPSPEDCLQTGDLLVVIGPEDSLRRLETMAAG